METNKIKQLLLADRATGMSVRAVCAKVGIPTASFYNYIEGNTKPDSETLRKFARAYNIRLSEFLTDIPEDERSGYAIRGDGEGGFKKVPFGPSINDKPEPYKPLTADEKAILEMLKDDPDLARRARRFIQFEKSDDSDNLADQTKVA